MNTKKLTLLVVSLLSCAVFGADAVKLAGYEQVQVSYGLNDVGSGVKEARSWVLDPGGSAVLTQSSTTLNATGKAIIGSYVYTPPNVGVYQVKSNGFDAANEWGVEVTRTVDSQVPWRVVDVWATWEPAPGYERWFNKSNSVNVGSKVVFRDANVGRPLNAWERVSGAVSLTVPVPKGYELAVQRKVIRLRVDTFRYPVGAGWTGQSVVTTNYYDAGQSYLLTF